MNTQVVDSIFKAVSDGSQKQWSDEEKARVLSNSSLLNQLQSWADNNNSDGCWHSENYELIKPKCCIANTNNSIADEQIHIPF
jgi:hypothetical protein